MLVSISMIGNTTNQKGDFNMKESLKLNKYTVSFFISIIVAYIGMYTVTHIYNNEIFPMVIFGIIFLLTVSNILNLMIISDFKKEMQQNQSQPKS